MKTKSVALYLLNQVLSLVVVSIVLFWSAGRIDWWPAWAVIVVWGIWFAAVDVVTLRLNPELMAERLSPPKGAKTWDKTIVSILRLTELLRYILGGLDQRYGWTVDFPLIAQIVALLLCFLSTALFVWAMASNAFFSQIVRIQSDRSHMVVTGGPYHYVRHPGYSGTILYEFALSSLLASWWAILAAGLCALLLVLRTVLEDRTLQAELTGYAEYAQQVRYRLIPGIW